MAAMNDLPAARENGTDQAAEADGMRTELSADQTSARQARGAIREVLAAWRMEDFSGDAELLASELVANAAEYGDGKPIGLVLSRHAEPDGWSGITSEVTDTSPIMSRHAEPGARAERGRTWRVDSRVDDGRVQSRP